MSTIKPSPIRLGFEHRLVLHQRARSTEKNDKGEDIPGEILATGVLIYRDPTTQRKQEYMAQVNKLLRLAASDDAEMARKGLSELIQMRIDNASEILVDAEGFEFPPNLSAKEGMLEYGGDFLQQLAMHAFEDEYVKLDRDIDLGKFEGGSSSSKKASSARSPKASASG